MMGLPSLTCGSVPTTLATAVPWAAIIAAVSGLLGVSLGGWITSRSQARERAHRRLREQIDVFYGPLLGMRAHVLAKGKVREEIITVSNEAWQKICARFEGNPVALKQVTDTRWPEYEGLIKQTEVDLREVLIPTFKAMVDLFVAKVALAEPSTRSHLDELVRYVEGWRPELPLEVRFKVGADESRLAPFYADLETQLALIQKKLKDG
jgi:hypothetical protein